MEWLQVQSASALIAAFRERGEKIRDEAIEAAFDALRRGSDPNDVVQQLGRTLTGKLLHHPSARLRASGGDDDLLRHARILLALDDDEPPS